MGSVKCAACSTETELCQSGIIDGVQQPRICKPCLLKHVRGEELQINDVVWIQQIATCPDAAKQLDTLRKQSK
jgi:hypothetical protein